MQSQGFFSGKNVLITGGAGFIGSSLALKLVELGANVTILDAMLPLYGGNMFNLESIKDRIKFVKGDIRDRDVVDELILGKDFVFDLAAQVSYIDSRDLPFLDLEINCKGHLNILEASRNLNPDVRIIFASSRLVYGKIFTMPVTEDHPTEPLSIYGIHKLTAEKYLRYYNQTFGLDTVIARIPNPYGPRQQMKHSKYSIVGWFLRQAFEGKVITVFGDGKQERDYLYIDDIVSAFLALAEKGKSGEIYNLGAKERVTFIQMIDAILQEVGQGKKEYVEWPKNYEKNETGNYVASIEKITKDTGWAPKVSLRDGVKEMTDFYRKYKENYLLDSSDFSIGDTASSYIKKRFPNASKIEQDKYIKDWNSKINKSYGVAKDFSSRVNINLEGKNILEAGCGNGGMSIAFAKLGANMTGVEIEKELVNISKQQASSNNVNVRFDYYDGSILPYEDNSFDAALSVSVVEHVTDPINYLKEILRVVKPGGYLYLAYPNRLWPKETHTQLWFVSWLPTKYIDKVIRLFDKNPLADNNLHFYTYWFVLGAVNKVRVDNFRWEILKESGNSQNFFKNSIKKVMNYFGISYKTLLPHISLILKKTE